ncbi:MAG: hypothetical protein ACI9SJ_002130 [Flavobacteriaceae bacterium]|jgi:hypothetical protein|uniref:NRDE family protein n=1 Tax=Candidatus Marifrigoribacter sp. Uisw_064 TaxID=3230970 RepID=UPI003AE90125
MCTVSFIPISENDFILTSNRDESPFRKTLTPKVYKADDVNLLFPKDELAGGTWIGASDKKRLICLLNGGFSSHVRKEKYRLSRGVIVTDLLKTDDVYSAIKKYNFIDVEPFTIILVSWESTVRLYELVWDGTHSYFVEKPSEPIIWSSSLLYSEEIKRKRQKWFAEFLESQQIHTLENLLNFHKTKGDGNKESDLIMDRGFVKTKSITQFSTINGKGTMSYEDLKTNIISQKNI